MERRPREKWSYALKRQCRWRWRHMQETAPYGNIFNHEVQFYVGCLSIWVPTTYIRDGAGSGVELGAQQAGASTALASEGAAAMESARPKRPPEARFRPESCLTSHFFLARGRVELVVTYIAPAGGTRTSSSSKRSSTRNSPSVCPPATRKTGPEAPSSDRGYLRKLPQLSTRGAVYSR